MDKVREIIDVNSYVDRKKRFSRLDIRGPRVKLDVTHPDQDRKKHERIAYSQQ